MWIKKVWLYETISFTDYIKLPILHKSKNLNWKLITPEKSMSNIYPFWEQIGTAWIMEIHSSCYQYFYLFPFQPRPNQPTNQPTHKQKFINVENWYVSLVLVMEWLLLLKAKNTHESNNNYKWDYFAKRKILILLWNLFLN